MKGITLFELLISLTLGSAVLTATILGILQINQSLALKRTALKIAAFIEHSSIEAIRKGDEINIAVLNNRLVSERKSLLFEKGIELFSIRPSANLNLYPTGVASPSQIVISNQRKNCVLTLSLRGRVNYRC